MLMTGFSIKNPETFTAVVVGYDYTMNSGQDGKGRSRPQAKSPSVLAAHLQWEAKIFDQIRYLAFALYTITWCSILEYTSRWANTFCHRMKLITDLLPYCAVSCLLEEVNYDGL